MLYPPNIKVGGAAALGMGSPMTEGEMLSV